MILPDIEIDDRGDLRLDWWISKYNVLAIYITGDGKLGYASLMGSGRTKSGEIELPEPIKEFFREMQESPEV